MSALDALLKRMLDQQAGKANATNRAQMKPQVSYSYTPGPGQRDADRQMQQANDAWMAGDNNAFNSLSLDNQRVTYPYGNPAGGGGGAGASSGNGMIQSVPGPNGTTQYLDSNGVGVSPSGTWKRDSAGRLFDSSILSSMAGDDAGFGGAGGSGGGSGGSGADGFGGSLGQAVGSGYEGIIANGGNILTPLQRAGSINRVGSTIARGGEDAIQAAREDAVRRGDTTGSTLADTEARIRGQSAANQANAQTDQDMALRREATGNLMGALGGGTNLIGAQAANRLAQGQLGLQNAQFGLSALGTLAQLNK